MSSNLFGIGLSGLNAAQLSMSTISNNISNASTPGYDRELALLAESHGMETSSGFMGSGVTTVTIQRQFNQTLQTELNNAQSQSSSLSSYSQLISSLSNQIGDPTSGIGADITAFFNSMQQLSGSPDDGPTRKSAINSAQVLADAIRSMGQQIDQMRQGVNTTLSSTVTQVNNLTKQIAQLNAQIAAAGSSGQPPNQLLDARDQAVSQLSQLVGVNVQQASDGTDSITLANGMSLVQVSSRIRQSPVRWLRPCCPIRPFPADRSVARSSFEASRSTRPHSNSVRSQPVSPRRSTRKTRSASIRMVKWAGRYSRSVTRT
jgi:flagellar hook-associated protein 1